MTMETFKKAEEIISEIGKENGDIVLLKNLMTYDTKDWEMTVGANGFDLGFPIAHLGLLPELLETIYKKHLEKVESLKKELAEL